MESSEGADTVEQPRTETVSGAREAHDALVAKGQELPGLIFERPDKPGLALVNNAVRRADDPSRDFIYDIYGINDEGLVRGQIIVPLESSLDYERSSIDNLQPCLTEEEIQGWHEAYDQKVAQLEERKSKQQSAEDLAKRSAALTDVLAKITGKTITPASQPIL